MTDKTKFYVAFASASIAPVGPLINWITQENYQGVLDPIEVQVLIFQQGEKQAMLVSFDLVETRSSLVGKLRNRIEREIGIPATNILMQATHTHSAPRFPYTNKDTHPAHLERFATLENDSTYHAWSQTLSDIVLRCVHAASDKLQPVTAGIRRIYAGDWVYNRRAIQPDGKVTTLFSSQTPFAQPDGNRFGVCDPTLTALQFQGEDSCPAATLLHFASHPVNIYPTDKRLSADWPGFLRRKVSSVENAPAIFLQGCAGDQVPVRRGLEAAEEMSECLSARLEEATICQSTIELSPLRVRRVEVELPQIDQLGAPAFIKTEVQVIAFGNVALVAMPGEIFIGIGLEIQRQSPFPHTLCLGYSNGHGTGYTGLPIEKERGGYESEPRVSHGKAECGTILVKAATTLLHELAEEVTC